MRWLQVPETTPLVPAFFGGMLQRQQVNTAGYNDIQEQDLIAYNIKKAKPVPWELDPAAGQDIEKIYSNVLKNLCWRGCGIGNDVLPPLSQALQDTTHCTSVDLSNNNMGSDVTALVDALKVNSSITRLDLQGNTIGAEGATAIFEGLMDTKTSTIVHLDLSNNNVGDGVWDPALFSVAKLISQGSKLEVLHLSGNRIGIEGMRPFFSLKAFHKRNRCSLQVFDLSCNQIGNEGKVYLLFCYSMYLHFSTPHPRR